MKGGGSRRGEKAELLAALRERFGLTENAAISLGRLHNASIRRLERELGELVVRERSSALQEHREAETRSDILAKCALAEATQRQIARVRQLLEAGRAGSEPGCSAMSVAREPARCADCGDSFIPEAVERAVRCPNCGSARRPREVAA